MTHKITYEDSRDIEVCVRGSLGHHSKAIAKATRLSESQVNYRLKKAGISRREYRDGMSEISHLAMGMAGKKIASHWHNTLVPRYVARKEKGST